jgi:2-dehydro-3-deoxygluconokinase
MTSDLTAGDRPTGRFGRRTVRADDDPDLVAAFVAGLLFGVLDQLDLPVRLDRAVTTGAFAVAGRGDWEGLPSRAELSLLDHAPGTAVR